MAQATLTWNDNSNREFGFSVERRTGEGDYAVIAIVDASREAPPGGVSYIDSTVVEEETYTYRVRAFNAGGYSAYTDEFTIVIPGGEEPPADALMVYRFEDTPGFLIDEGTKGYDLSNEERCLE